MLPTLLAFVFLVCGAIASPECVCTLELNPVCGEDGVTYDTSCVATCKGVVVSHEGPCEGHTADPEEDHEHKVTEGHEEVYHQEEEDHTGAVDEASGAEHKEGEAHGHEGQGHSEGEAHQPSEGEHRSNDSDDKSDSKDSDSHSESKDD